MKYDIVRRVLSSLFSRIGYHIACHPFLYIIICIFASTILSIGMLRIKLVTSIEYLYSPINGRARVERDSLESLFPPNLSSDYDFLRISKFGKIGSVIVVPKNNGSMLDENIMNEIWELDIFIRNITFTWNNISVKYDDLCPRTVYGKCFENFISSLRGKVKEIKNGKYPIKYPITKTEGEPIITAVNLGGVHLNERNELEDFEVARLFYPIDYSTEEKNKMALKWEEEFLNQLTNINLETIHVYKFAGKTFDDELNKVSEMVLPHIFVVMPIMMTFAALSCISSDVIISKPWLGIAGCVSPIISTISAFGLLLYFNFEYIDLNLVITFLMLGIGIDDSFVMLASWRRTNRNDSVRKRMSDAYADAAVSVTITSLTNLFSFCLGLTTPYRVIHIFSIYSALSILFDYIYQIFFFGAIMALDGYREEYNIHAIFCVRVNSSKITEDMENDDTITKDTFMMSFFNNLGILLQNNVVKLIVIILFFTYLGCGIYFMKWIKEGLDYINIFPLSSYVVKYMVAHYQHFTEYPHRIHLVINQTLDYSDPNVQEDIESLLNSFETAPFMADSSVSECWLREYLSFIKEPVSRFSLKGYNLSNSEEFLDGFKNVFLKFKWARRFNKDVLFNSEGNKILASRFFVQSHNVRNSSSEKFLLQNVRKIAENSKYSVFVYNLWFILYDQYLDVVITCIQTVGIAALVISIIFVVFIPNLICTLAVMLTVISIQVGVVGFMSAWNVNVDSVTMIILVMCTGFCVDYSSHISFAYLNCKENNPNEKIRISLYAVGYPILQGCISTILGVTVLYFGESYLFVIFFKVVFLVMFFATFHGLILLPVVLSIADSIWLLNFKKHSDSDKRKEHEMGNFIPLDKNIENPL